MTQQGNSCEVHRDQASARSGSYFCTRAIVDFSLGFETWKMLFSPKLNTGTRAAPVLTAILTKPCMTVFQRLETVLWMP